MDKKNKSQIPGTIVSAQNGNVLVSSGIPSLDLYLGGGLPVGTVTLIEEDFHGLYSKIVLKYFIAEGILSNHSTLIASQEVNPAVLIKELPAVIDSDQDSDVASVSKASPVSSDKMKIAFRYQNLSNKNVENTKHIGHYYDLSRPMDQKNIENSDISYWTGQRIEYASTSFSNPAYNHLLRSIKTKIKDGGFFLKDEPKSASILRIGIHSLGSPMWLPHRTSIHSMDNNRDLDMFIFCLRALVRSANAVAVITVPSYLYHEVSLVRCIHSSDIAIRLQSFSGTELEKNNSLADYHGFFYITKLGAVNSLATRHPDSLEFVFKLRRKKFVIEVLHLPPDLQDNKDGTKENKSSPVISCGGSNRHLLDF